MWLRWSCGGCGANNACGLFRCPRCQARPPWITPLSQVPDPPPEPELPPELQVPDLPAAEPFPRSPRAPRKLGAKSG
jgi:hypothetical protein